MSIRENDPRLVNSPEYFAILSELLAQGLSVNLTVSGNSMSPFLINGRDQVLLEPLEQKPRVGDVIFYRRDDGSYILHRICSITIGAYTFLGDNQTQPEYGIRRDQLLAKVTAVKRDGQVLKPGCALWRFFAGPWAWFWGWRPFFRWLYNTIKRR
jgi:hypothetical protein